MEGFRVFKEADFLRSAKNLISNQANWSPCGSGVLHKTYCALSAIREVSSNAADAEQRSYFLTTAYKQLFGYGEITDLNDGTYECVRIAPDDRFKMVHQVYDLAIKLAEQEEAKNES